MLDHYEELRYEQEAAREESGEVRDRRDDHRRMAQGLTWYRVRHNLHTRLSWREH